MFITKLLRFLRNRLGLITLVGLVAILVIVAVAAQNSTSGYRQDTASEIPIVLDGSLQNAAWSPNGAQIIFTRFRDGYNKAPADIMIFDRRSAAVRALLDDGHGNVSQPGSTWNARTDSIVFSSTRTGHDEIFLMKSAGALDTLKQLTSDERYNSYEPSMSPDGRSVVFESHLVDEEENGSIKVVSVGSFEVDELTDPDEDCRQPNWSPTGNEIVYQKKDDGQWDLWIYDIVTKVHRKLTEGEGDKTDATFSPDGHWVVYSADNAELRQANLFVISVQGGTATQITRANAYDGAPSWSLDGKSIVFESSAYPSEPGWRGAATRIWRRLTDLFHSEPPTRLWTMEMPAEVLQRLCSPSSPCR